MSEKRTKADKAQRQADQLEEKTAHRPSQLSNKASMEVNVVQCPRCSAWLVVPALFTQSPRAKTCINPKCGNTTFSFTTSDVQVRDVPEELANRGYFLDSKI